jgi:short subunit fatty acids transporter
MTDLNSINPILIPIAGTIFGTVMIVAIVGIVFWFKAREKELQVHQDMRLREMDHQLKMKELELQIEKTKAQQIAERVV